MGDASGVGPEIIMKGLAHFEIYGRCRPLVIGDAGQLRKAASLVDSGVTVNPIDHPSQARFTPGIADADVGVGGADVGMGLGSMFWHAVVP